MTPDEPLRGFGDDGSESVDRFGDVCRLVVTGAG
jgi:hypothetical protein